MGEPYTPTTEDLRRAWRAYSFVRDGRLPEEQFDRWLEDVQDEAFERGYDVGYASGSGGSDDW